MAEPAINDIRPREMRPIAIPLQSAGLLSSLIFMISGIYEILVINSLYQSQYFLIALLLGGLSLWAFLEVVLIRRPRSVRWLKLLLAIQMALMAGRHWHDFRQSISDLSGSGMRFTKPDLHEAALFLPIYLVLFLAISRCLLNLFAAAERLRANQLQEQMTILRQTKAELQLSENRYRNFFNLPLVGTAIISTDNVWVDVNDKTCSLLGYSRQELFSRTWTDLTHPDDLVVEIEQFERIMRREVNGYQIEKRFIRKDGSIVHTLMAGCRGQVATGEPELFHMNLIDISDRKQIETALSAAQAREAALAEQQRHELELKLKTSLTASAVVHEIQQPLATILLNCRLAEETIERLPESAIPADLRSQLSQLTDNGEQVTATMQRMRMLLRNVATQTAPIDLTTSVESALVYLRRDLRQQQVRLSSGGLHHPCPLLGDGAQLQSAIVNLIRNAIQAMGGQPPDSRRLLVGLQRCDDHIEIQVEDSGPGFPRDYSGTTSWELLKSTKASGMGLGLFIAQTAATNHGGGLRIGRSEALGGALVVLNLPRRPPPASL